MKPRQPAGSFPERCQLQRLRAEDEKGKLAFAIAFFICTVKKAIAVFIDKK